MLQNTLERVVLIGFGSIGKRHLRNLISMFPGTQIGIVSKHLTVAPENTVLIDSIKHAIAWNPELGVISNAANLHTEVALPLLENEIPLFIEKPIDISTVAASRLQPFATRPGIMLGYCLRFSSVFQKIRDTIEAGVIGIPQNIHAVCTSYLPDWRPGTDYRDSVSAKPDRGGGALLEISHEIDYVCGLLGDPVSVVCEEVGPRVLDIPVEENVKLQIDFKQAAARIDLSFATKSTARKCTVQGTEGVITANFLTQEVNCVADGKQLFQLQFSDDPNEMYVRELQAMIDLVQQDVPNSANYSAGLTALKVVESSKQSIISGQRELIQ